jgi:hypothetical protein
MYIYYKNFEELLKDNPEAVGSSDGYLTRPDGGWREDGDIGFIGIGYHGNEGGYWDENWVKEKVYGHIPTNGYG